MPRVRRGQGHVRGGEGVAPPDELARAEAAGSPHVPGISQAPPGRPRVAGCGSELRAGGPSRVELKGAGDGEGTRSYVLGRSEEVDVRVGTPQKPYRIDIDVAHP